MFTAEHTRERLWPRLLLAGAKTSPDFPLQKWKCRPHLWQTYWGYVR